MRINLSDYLGQPFPDDPQKQMVSELIMQLRYYITAPINELNDALPKLEALEKQCNDFDKQHGKEKIHYIIEILAVLHEEARNERNRNALKETEERFFSRMVISLKEKIAKIKAAGKGIYASVNYRQWQD